MFELFKDVLLPFSLFIMMIALGLGLTWAHFRTVIEQPKMIGIGLGMQLLLLPLLAILLVKTLSIPDVIAVGLLVLAFAPGGVTSSIYTHLSAGNVPLSVSLTAIASIIAPFWLPFVAVWILDIYAMQTQDTVLSALDLMWQLVWITIVPVVLGMLALHYWPNWVARIRGKVSALSMVFFVMVLLILIYLAWEPLWQLAHVVGMYVLFLNLLAIVMGFFLPYVLRIGFNDSLTMSYEVALQNGTIALVVLTALGITMDVLMPVVLYSVLMFITGFLLSGLYAYVKRAGWVKV